MSDETMDENVDTLHQVVSIVAAYVSHNAMRAVELPEFISAVHASIRQLTKDQVATESKPPENPAVPVKRSVSKEFIVCLECGKKFKSLRRHLSSFHGLTPDEYRAKWGLQSDYPMVAPAYSATRSQLARESGLGQISRGGEGAGRASEDEATADMGAGPAVEPVEDEAAASEPAAGMERAEASAKPTDDKPTGAKPTAVESSAAVSPMAEASAADSSAAEAPKKAKRGRPRKVAA